MSYSRKTTAAFAFGSAFALAICLTAFLRWRPLDVTPEIVEPSVAITCGAADISFRVEQAIVDFAERQSITTLKLTLSAGEDVPASVWVWTDYYEIAPAAVAPPVDEGGNVARFVPEDERGRVPQPAPAVMRLRAWTSRPQQIYVTGERRLRVAAECPVCDERPEGKPTFYARVHVTAMPPDAAAIERTSEDFDATESTPVIVQGIEE